MTGRTRGPVLYYFAAQLQWLARWLVGSYLAEVGAYGDEHRDCVLPALMLGVILQPVQKPKLLNIALPF